MSSTLRIFVPSDCIFENKALIKGGDALHVTKVMRLNIGDEITVCDMKKNVYRGIIESVTKDEVLCVLEKTDKKDTEFPCTVTVYQGVPKGDKLETVIQKSVELGAARIVPVLCDRSVSRPDKKSATSKNARYNKIAESAASQSGRILLPVVSPMITFDEMLSEVTESSAKTLFFACYEGEEQVKLKDLIPDSPTDISFFIGPEGGISEREIEKLCSASIPTVSLGKRILRTETASLYVLSSLSFWWE